LRHRPVAHRRHRAEDPARRARPPAASSRRRRRRVRRRGPSESDRALWRAALKDVTPLPGRPAPPPTPPPPSPAAAEKPPTGTAGERRGRGLDRRTAERLRRGELPIAARLDLHGMTQEEAHRALVRFLARAQAAGQRCVLVITGKG